jgi:hypothetical protein
MLLTSAIGGSEQEMLVMLRWRLAAMLDEGDVPMHALARLDGERSLSTRRALRLSARAIGCHAEVPSLTEPGETGPQHGLPIPPALWQARHLCGHRANGIGTIMLAFAGRDRVEVPRRRRDDPLASRCA